jgi:hypothetical protein
MSAYTYPTRLVQATVAAGKIFSTFVDGLLVQYVAGDTVYVHKEDYVRLQREGILV